MKLSDYRKIAPDINDTIRAVLKKHGFEVDKVRATVGDHDGSLSIRVAAHDANKRDAHGDATNPDREAYKMFATAHDLKVEWLDVPFKWNGDTMRIVGLKRKASKRNIVLAQDGKSQRLVAPAASVKHFMERTIRENERMMGGAS